MVGGRAAKRKGHFRRELKKNLARGRGAGWTGRVFQKDKWSPSGWGRVQDGRTA
jgi:hypothetical protein